jgi:hypothetical protein
MALHGRAAFVAKTRPCKAMTVAPKRKSARWVMTLSLLG